MEIKWEQSSQELRLNKLAFAMQESKIDSILEDGDYFSIDDITDNFIVLCSMSEDPVIITIEEGKDKDPMVINASEEGLKVINRLNFLYKS